MLGLVAGILTEHSLWGIRVSKLGRLCVLRSCCYAHLLSESSNERKVCVLIGYTERELIYLY